MVVHMMDEGRTRVANVERWRVATDETGLVRASARGDHGDMCAGHMAYDLPTWMTSTPDTGRTECVDRRRQQADGRCNRVLSF